MMSTYSFSETLSPLQQSKQEIPAEETICKEGFVLMIRESGDPACMTPPGFLRSIDRGWGQADLDLMQKHPDQVDSVISAIMHNLDLRNMVIERIAENPEVLEKIKDNERLMNVLEGKGMMNQGEAGAQMGGMFGSSDAGKKMEKAMSDIGFKTGDSKLGNMIGGMVDKMMPKMMQGMENNPSMGAQMRTSDNLMGKLFK